MVPLCSMLLHNHDAQFDAGIIHTPLVFSRVSFFKELFLTLGVNGQERVFSASVMEAGSVKNSVRVCAYHPASFIHMYI